jgi:hypothetical protein
MATGKPKTQKDVASEILKYAHSKHATGDSQVPEKDPADKGSPSVSEDPDTSKMVGKDQPEPKNPKDDTIVGAPTSSSSESPEGTEDGNKREHAYTDPNTPLSKIAKRVSSGLLDLVHGKAGEAEPEKKAGEAEPEKKAGEAEPEKKAGEAEAGKKGEPEKKADTDILSKIDGDTLRKVATHILETEEGKNYAIEVLTKKAGQEAAENLLKEAASEAEAIEAYQQKQAQTLYQAELEKKAYTDAFSKLSEEDKAYVEKSASVHEAAMAEIEDPILKYAYAQGVMDSDAMLAEEPGTIPGAEEAPSLEQIAQVLEAMVASGEISEEDALAALEILAAEIGGGEGDPAMAGGDPAMAGGDPAMAGVDPAMAGGDPGMKAAGEEPKKGEGGSEKKAGEADAEKQASEAVTAVTSRAKKFL